MELTVKRVDKKADKTKLIFNISTIVGFFIIGIFLLYGFRKGIFTSREVFCEYILNLGFLAPFVFIFIQAIQVVIPILPGAIGCAAGVIAFGGFFGFLYNYIGITLGSILAFLIAKRYGIIVVKKLVNPKTFDKYESWLNEGTRFDKLFAGAILAPVAPDDFLCYLAGLTKMSLRKFVLIIIFCKPLSILIYSIGLTGLFNFIANLF